MGRRTAVLGTMLVVLLGTARPSHAGLLEIIWEMSGPQMLGIAYGCIFPLRSVQIERCRLGPTPTVQHADTFTNKVFLVLGGSLLGSTGKDSSTQGYDWGEIWMVEAAPGVTFRSVNREKPRLQVHHGVGVAWELLFGRDIRRFDKFAFTVTPIDVVYRRVAVGMKLRLYPHGFTDDEFKPGPRLEIDRPFETSVGFTFSFVLDRN